VWWWLRSPGNNSNNAANVNNDGSVNDNGNNVDNTNGAVRPALPVYLKPNPALGGLSKREKGSNSFLASDRQENICWRKVKRVNKDAFYQ